MKKYFFLPAVILILFSCNMNTPAAHQKAGATKNNTYLLHLNPGAGLQYHYETSSESDIRIKVNDKEVNNSSRTVLGLNYGITKDSGGNYLISIGYDKITMHSKKGEEESDLDAANAATGTDPVEKILGIMKDAHLTAVANASGEIQKIEGYSELTANIMAQVSSKDAYLRQGLQKQWEQMGDALIKKNIAQLFHRFPDSAMGQGATWTRQSVEKDEMNLQQNATYTLEDIDSEKAVITFTAQLKSDSASSTAMGMQVLSQMKGVQQGEYELDTQTGMIQQYKSSSEIAGTMTVMGREVPVTIKKKVEMKGKKVK